MYRRHYKTYRENLLNIAENSHAAAAADAPIKPSSGAMRHAAELVNHIVAGTLAVIILYLSMVTTSAPVTPSNWQTIDRAISVLEAKGFGNEAFLLRNVTTFRSSDNWLNGVMSDENAYAATNFPFGIITVYPDFYSKAQDDTERAMILLHEAQHLKNADEREAYAYVWRNRERLGWTTLSHGTTPTFVTVELQTRENAPELFTCAANLWHDCTEQLRASR